MKEFVVVQSFIPGWLFATPWTAALQTSLSVTISQSLLKLMPIESVIPLNHLILCYLVLLPSIFPTIRIFSSELALCSRWPKHCSFSFSISPSHEYSGLISFKVDSFNSLQSKRCSFIAKQKQKQKKNHTTVHHKIITKSHGLRISLEEKNSEFTVLLDCGVNGHLQILLNRDKLSKE